MFKSGFGDSFLVRLELKKETINIMIDCGFGYKDEILPRLKKIVKDDETISRFIITHYDSDHIKGAILFIEENGDYATPKIIKIEQVWLNTFRHIQFSKMEVDKLEIEEELKIKNLVSNLNSKLNTGNEDGDIGAKQATTLGKVLYEKKYLWNKDFNNKAVCLENKKEIIISNELKLHLLSPNIDGLKRLEDEFILKLTEMNLKPNTDGIFDDAFELYSQAHHEEKISIDGNISSSRKVINSRTIKLFSMGQNYERDNSIGNGSSIAFIIESEEKNILFLGDAFAEDIIKELKIKFPDSSKYPIYFDAIKVSHHGSFKNNSPELFKIIDSGKFLFSTNGKHQSHIHPDIETISCIINRELPYQIIKRDLIFNYELEHLRGFSNESLKIEFNYDIKIQEEIEI